MSQQDELTELLSQLAGNLRDEDLEDPELTVLLSQLVTIFEGKPEDLDPELIEQLLQVKDTKERFIRAAMAVGAGDPNSLKALSDSMEHAGLFKSEIKKAKPGHTPQATPLGYTRSGRSVHHLKPAASYPKSVFTSEDHKDAAALHYAHAKRMKEQGKPTKPILHHSMKHGVASGETGFNPKEHYEKHKDSFTHIKKTDPLKKAEIKAVQKADRSAFVYMNPREKHYDNFAQCGSCMMFTGKTCTIHGPDISVGKSDSCALYVPGDPMPGEKGHEMKSVTPEESGLYSGQVRCENCKFYKKGGQECGLYQALNEKVSGKFSLEERVHPKACCNAFVGK